MSNDESFEEMFRKRFGRAPTKDELNILIDQSVKSYNQSGGITAHTVNLGPQPRKMNQALKNQILKDLPRDKPITIMAIMGDGESMEFGQEIHAFLKANGFPLAEDGISQGVFTTAQKGLNFNSETSQFIVGTNIP